MMKKVFFLAAAAIAVLVSSCQKEGSAEIDCFSSVQEIPYTGGTASAFISCNTYWEASCDDPVAVVEPKSGRGDKVITVTLPATTDKETRSVEVYVKATYMSSIASITFCASQDAHPFLMCSEPEKTVNADASAVYFYVNSNYPWKIKSMTCDGTPWSGNVAPVSYEKNGVEVRAEIPANVSGKDRVFAIELALDDYPDEKVTLKVSQGK